MNNLGAWLTSSRLRNFICTMSLWFMIAFHILQLAVPLPIKRYPDLYWIANNAFSYAVFMFMYVFAHCKMMTE